MENKEVIKACVYANAEGHYVPVAFMAVKRDVNLVDKQNGESSRYKNGRPAYPMSDGTRIVPMGKYRPIKGIIERMTLVDFEGLMENFGFSYLCTIPSDGMKEPREVYDAFNIMLKGAKCFCTLTSEIAIEPYNESESENKLEAFRECNPGIVAYFNKQIQALWAAGQKITAIEVYRYAHGCSTSEAYTAVNEIIGK